MTKWWILDTKSEAPWAGKIIFGSWSLERFIVLGHQDDPRTAPIALGPKEAWRGPFDSESDAMIEVRRLTVEAMQKKDEAPSYIARAILANWTGREV